MTSSRETGEALTAAALRKARQDVIPRPSRPARRRALPEQYRRLVDDLDTASRKLAALHRDDRFGDNRASLTFKAVLLAEIAERLAALAGEIGPQPALPSPTLYASISDSNDNVVGSPPASGEVTATMSARRSPRGAMVHLYVKGGSTVVAGRGQAVTAVRSALERLGVTSMRSPHPPRKLTFPAARVDDVQALLEADGHAVELVRWSQ